MIVETTERATLKRPKHASELLASEPPHDLDAEMCVLGSILLFPEVLDDLAKLQADDFCEDANRSIFATLTAMHGDGEAIDAKLSVARLTKAGKYESVGGAAYLAKLSNAVPNAAHAAHYARIVADASAYRQVIAAGIESIEQAYEQKREPRHIWGWVQEKAADQAERSPDDRLAPLSVVLNESLDAIEARMRGEDTIGPRHFLDFHSTVRTINTPHGVDETLLLFDVIEDSFELHLVGGLADGCCVNNNIHSRNAGEMHLFLNASGG